ncbi:hypothetical protein [uncultured Sulfitobacter sp.]|uniref:hypothetical protein n=1 Tax=uncultured Sulfitobacter sp. TaxID=191468 RepID=UPI0026063408|nr:hypothetical protein [uncultured Sulfitobacter sp.]
MLERFILPIALLASPALPTAALADPASVHDVRVAKSGGAYTFNVTILHSDTGWDDYADAWRIKDMEGNVLGMRQLAHPHVNEQPFTRSLSGVKIPDGIKSVVIEARDTVTGWSPQVKTINLP